MPAGAAGRVQALSEQDPGVHRAGSTWPWEPRQSLQATPPSRSQLALVSSLEQVLTPESSRELVGCRKPLIEADMYKQQPGPLVTGSMGSRSLSRMTSVQKACPDLDSEAAAAGARVGRGTLGAGPLYCASYFQRQEKGQTSG